MAAWVWQGCHTLLICENLCNLWENILRQKFFAICGRVVMLVHVCFVGAAGTAAPPKDFCENLWENIVCSVGAVLALASGKAEWG